MKAHSEPKTKPKQRLKLETKTKPETKIKPKQTPKAETKTKPETKLEIKVNKKKLKKLRKNFDELRYKFSKTEKDEHRKAFYIAKNYKTLFESEIEKTMKRLNKLKKV